MSKEHGKEIVNLLQILKDTSDQQISSVSCDTGKLIRLAEMHRVTYPLLVYAQQHEGVFSGEQISQLDSRCRQNAQRSLVQLHELTRMAIRLNETGIGYVCIKGPQLARMIYGREAFKESVDLDIMLVNQKDLSAIHDTLTGLGYTRSNLNNFKTACKRMIFLIAQREVHYFSRETRCAIDLHVRPGANTYLTASRFRSILSEVSLVDLEGTAIPVLPDEAYFVYLCYHGSLHQFSRLAWLQDIRAFLSLKRNLLDYEKLMIIARSLRTERGVYLAMLLLQQYFGDEIPEQLKKQIVISKRLNFLASVCHRMLLRDTGYGFTLHGRAGKLIYMMFLIKGFAGKIDLIYGIFMRFVVKRILR